MLDSIFILFLSGCGDAGQVCEPLVDAPKHYVSVTACEEDLLHKMASGGADWPMLHGICIETEPGVAALPPEDWPGHGARTVLAGVAR